MCGSAHIYYNHMGFVPMFLSASKNALLLYALSSSNAMPHDVSRPITDQKPNLIFLFQMKMNGSNKRIRNPNTNNPPLRIPPLERHTTHILHNPISTSLPQLPNRMRSRQRHHAIARSLTRPHSRRRILKHQQTLRRGVFKPQPSGSEAIAGWIRFAVRHFLCGDHEARVRELHHVEPAGDQRAGTGCDDGPGRAGGFEAGEEGAGAGDLGGVVAVVKRDFAFGGADVWRVC